MFEDIEKSLNEIQLKIALKHNSAKSDLFIEFLKQKKELNEKLLEFKKFTFGSFKEEINEK